METAPPRGPYRGIIREMHGNKLGGHISPREMVSVMYIARARELEKALYDESKVFSDDVSMRLHVGDFGNWSTMNSNGELLRGLLRRLLRDFKELANLV